MTEKHETGATSIVKDLAECFSVQSRSSNKLWVLLFIMTVFIMTAEDTYGENKKKELPFSLGEISVNIFDPMVFFMILAITLAFLAVHARTLHAYEKAQEALDYLVSGENENTLISQRFFFDMLTTSTFVRVAPLSDIARGKLWASKAIYISFKSFGITVIYALPVVSVLYGLYNMIINEHVSKIIIFISIPFFVITIMALLLVSYKEFLLIEKIYKKSFSHRLGCS